MPLRKIVDASTADSRRLRQPDRSVGQPRGAPGLRRGLASASASASGIMALGYDASQSVLVLRALLCPIARCATA
eukprot:scaffold51295_cov635-Isochrysis_galbana.AAC.1